MTNLISTLEVNVKTHRNNPGSVNSSASLEKNLNYTTF